MFFRRKKDVPANSFPGAEEIIQTTMRSLQHRYWFREGTLEQAVAAWRAYENTKDRIDAIEYIIEKNRFICNFDDPCDPINPWEFKNAPAH